MYCTVLCYVGREARSGAEAYRTQEKGWCDMAKGSAVQGGGNHARMRDELLRGAAREDLGAFNWYVNGWEVVRHQEIWYRELTDEKRDKVLIICPPSHTKTNVMLGYCEWRIGRNPGVRMGYLSETATQAEACSVAVRNTIEYNERYKEVFGASVVPDYKSGWGQGEWFVRRDVVGVKDATFGAFGVEGAYQGRRWDELVLDDICSPQNTSTKAQMEKVNGVLTGVAFKRVEKGGRMRAIATKWENGDALEMMERAGFYVIHMPALGYWELVEEVNRVRVQDSEQQVQDVGPTKNVGKGRRVLPGLVDVKGKTVKSTVEVVPEVKKEGRIFASDLVIPSVQQVREAHDKGVLDEGGALWESQWPKSVLLERRALDPVRFEKTEMGFVGASQGAVFERGWFGRFGMESVDWGRVELVLQSWDTAYGGSVSADDSVCVTIIVYNTGHLLIPSVEYGNWDQPSLERKVQEFYAAWRPGVVLVEDIGSGKSMMQNLSGSTLIPFLPVRNTFRGEKKDALRSAKTKRALSGSGLARQGRVLLLQDAPWLEKFLYRVCKFPFGDKDDDVDAYAQAVDWIMGQKVEMMKGLLEGEMGGVVMPKMVSGGEGEGRRMLEEDVVEVDIVGVSAEEWIC